jgi:hypothetical protein
MRKVMLAAVAIALSTIAASAQSSGPGLGFWGSGGGMSPQAFHYWYGGRSPAQVIRDEHVRICATNPQAPCHRRYARGARVR